MTGGGVVFMYHLSFEVKLIPKFVFERPGVSVNFLPFLISWLCTKSFQGDLPTWGRKWESQGKWRVLTLEQIGAGLTLTEAGGRLDVWGVKLELFGGVKALVTWFLSEAQKVSKTLILLRVECVGNRLFKKKIEITLKGMKEFQQNLTYRLADLTNWYCCAGGDIGRFVAYCAGSIFGFWLLASSVYKCQENALGLSVLL